MKEFILIGVLAGILFACSKDKDDLKLDEEKKVFRLDQYPQKWELVSITSSMMVPVVVTKGEDMQWQGYMVLNEDKSFTKNRTQNGRETTASGTYKFVDYSGEAYLELLYDAYNNLIESCSTTERKEYYRVDKESQLVGSWNACDGPTLIYERVE